MYENIKLIQRYPKGEILSAELFEEYRDLEDDKILKKLSSAHP